MFKNFVRIKKIQC